MWERERKENWTYSNRGTEELKFYTRWESEKNPRRNPKNVMNSRPFWCYRCQIRSSKSRGEGKISKSFRGEARPVRDAFADNDRYLGKEKERERGKEGKRERERVITLETRCDRCDAGHGNHTMLVIEPSNRVARAHHRESASYKHTDLRPENNIPPPKR